MWTRQGLLLESSPGGHIRLEALFVGYVHSSTECLGGYLLAYYHNLLAILNVFLHHLMGIYVITENA